MEFCNFPRKTRLRKLRHSYENFFRRRTERIAKNYLSKDEIDTLNRLVVIFIETAELRVKDRIDITLDFWRENVDRILAFNDKDILKSAGTISNAQMEEQVRKIYERFDKRRKAFEAEQADLKEIEELKELENKIEHRKPSDSE